MGVRVTHRLAGVTACIKDNAITGPGNALTDRNLVSLRRYLGKQPVLRAGEPREVRIVRFGNDEHMNRSLRIDVAKCEGAF